MPDIDTEELRRLTREATPGPWKWGWTTDLTSPPTKRFTKDSYTVEPAVCATSRLKGGFDDAALLVAMRNALPALLDRMEKLERVAEASRYHSRGDYVTRNGSVGWEHTPEGPVCRANGLRRWQQCDVCSALAALEATEEEGRGDG